MLIYDLSKYGINGVYSIQVFDQEPTDWSGNSTQIPPMVFTMEKYDTASKAELFISGLVGAIPAVGSVASGILNAFWPTGPNNNGSLKKA